MPFDEWSKRFGFEDHLRIQRDLERLTSLGVDQHRLASDAYLGSLAAPMNLTASDYMADYTASSVAAKQLKELTRGYNAADIESVVGLSPRDLAPSFTALGFDSVAGLTEHALPKSLVTVAADCLAAEQAWKFESAAISGLTVQSEALEALRRSLADPALTVYATLEPSWVTALGTTTALDQALAAGALGTLNDEFARSAAGTLANYSHLLAGSGWSHTVAMEAIRTAYDDVSFAAGSSSDDTADIGDGEIAESAISEPEVHEAIPTAVVLDGTFCFLEQTALKLLRRIAERCQVASTLPVDDGRWGPVASDLVCRIVVEFPDHAVSLAIKAGRVSNWLTLLAAPAGKGRNDVPEVVAVEDIDAGIDVLLGFVTELEAIEKKYL